MRLDYCQLVWLRETVGAYLDLYTENLKTAKGADSVYFEHLLDRIQVIMDEITAALINEKHRKLEAGELDETTHMLLVRWGGYCQKENGEWFGED